MNDVFFLPAIIIPQNLGGNYAGQDFEALPDGDASAFDITQSVQVGDVSLLPLNIEIKVQNDYGYDDFENLALPTDNVTSYPGVNVGNEPKLLGQATILPYVFSYGSDDFERYAVGAIPALNLAFSSGDVTMGVGTFII